MKLLQIDSSILGDNGASPVLTAAIVTRLKAEHPGLEVTRHDVVADPLPHLTADWLPGRDMELPQDPQARAAAERSEQVLEQFIAADIVVIGVPMYNLGIPSQLKTWLDRIVVRGRTFAYGASGVQGLAGGKKLYLGVARGGVYSAGSPAAAFEHQESYLKSVFGFLGITDITAVEAEGLAAAGGANRPAILAAALEKIAAL